MYGKIFIIFCVLLLPSGGYLNAEELPVNEIIINANHAALYQGSDYKGKIVLSIIDKQGRERKREIKVLRKDIGKGDGDQKYFAYFQSPADVRKMVFMVHKHADPETDDDRWLYMPGLDLVKRIAAGDKRTSFAGSDFLYEDISGRGPDEDYHELIKTTPEYYVVKNIPRQPNDVEFSHYIAYIDRNNFIPMKLEYFKGEGRNYRNITVMEVKGVEAEGEDGQVEYPTAIRSIASDLESGSETVMEFFGVEYNLGLEEELFSERYLRRPPREAIR